MPILLREAATAGDIALANNDMVFDVQTPRSMAEETLVFRSERDPAYKAWEREFRERKVFDWSAFIYWVPPDKRTDHNWRLDVKENYHIHMIAKLHAGKGLLVEKVLPKSAHEKGKGRIDLVDEPLSEWERLVAGMDHRTKIAVERFRTFYIERFMIKTRTI